MGRLVALLQACNSPKRFIVLGEHFDDFVSEVVSVFESVTIGDPADSATDLGPLSSVDARDTVVEQVRTAVSQGATLHTGGSASTVTAPSCGPLC